MARKRTRMRRDPHSFLDGMNQGHHQQPNGITEDGKVIKIHQISSSDEGVLYTHRITERPTKKKESVFCTWFRGLSNSSHSSNDNSIGKSRIIENRDTLAPPQSETLRAHHSIYGTAGQKQFTITKQKRYKNPVMNWLDKHHLNYFERQSHDADVHLYRPSSLLYRYINWTFYATFTGVFVTFLFIYFILVVLFGGFLYGAGNQHPECIIVSGQHFDQSPDTRFGDAFALSWTTFTTVGYGMTYVSTGGDFEEEEHHDCSLIEFLTNMEAFLGLLYAGMCGAILFGKVNRIQSHAKLIFSNAVCLQYEEVDLEDGDDDDDEEEGETFQSESNDEELDKPAERDEENQADDVGAGKVAESAAEDNVAAFVEQYNGCPVLKFQVVNELCNREGSEIVDAIMKVIGVKFKGKDGKVTHSQYVRVNLVDFEHPFFSRVWHGVHILDGMSPLLTDKAKRKIKENGGSWPGEWFHPEEIKSKLEFDDLIVTVAGISNISAVTVHSYKRYKIGDILIGFNFAPLVYRCEDTGRLHVDLSLVHDVREQQGGGGEDLQQDVERRMTGLMRYKSSIKIKAANDAL